jgi:hypothetical protein
MSKRKEKEFEQIRNLIEELFPNADYMINILDKCNPIIEDIHQTLKANSWGDAFYLVEIARERIITLRQEAIDSRKNKEGDQ